MNMNNEMDIIGDGRLLCLDYACNPYKQHPEFIPDVPKVMKPKKQLLSDKKCFRDGCENKRNGNKLYCSAECCKLDKKK